MELRILRYFLAVAREGSISRAAETIHITQPSLSRQIAQLEEEMGAKLLIRGSRKITLTDAGMLLRRRAEEIVALTEKTEQELSAFGSGEVRGTICIGCGELHAVQELSELIRTFHRLCPRVRFSFRSENADATKENIERGLLDFGVLLEPVDYDKFDFLQMGAVEPWVVLMRADDVLAEKNRITAEDLRGRTLLLPSRKLVRSQLDAWFGEALEEENVFSTNNLMNNAATLVEQGLGLALGVEYSPSLYDPNRFCYKRLYPDLVSRSVIVWKKHQPTGAAVTRFRDFLLMSLRHGEP